MAHTKGIGGSPLLQTLMTQTETVSAVGKKEQASTTATAAATVQQDRAQLSTAANALMRNASTSDDVRAEKVAALQNAITNGTYSVSASDVADSVIRSLLK